MGFDSPHTCYLAGGQSGRIQPQKERSIKSFQEARKMKNIYEIMKEFGIEIPEDKKEGFDKA